MNPQSELEEDLLPCWPETNATKELFMRFLQEAQQNDDENGDSTSSSPIVLWKIIYTSLVLVGMLIALLSDRVGADGVMLTALTAFLAPNIISLQEALVGFSNDGLLTVLVLFVVARGMSATGALDWYMGRLLGLPSTLAGAQLRLCIPIAIVSAFLNNTPVVAVMIPIVLKWAKSLAPRATAQELLIPLSFASILGGTCTLIGTSTNLVVAGLLVNRYPGDDSVSIGLFDLGEFGVPVAILGIAYLLLASPYLLPPQRALRKGDNNENGDNPAGGGPWGEQANVLLGARLLQWSPAAGRSVKRSGLRDTGGIYLVSVYRATTGNVHRAVGQDFVLNVGDVLYFTAGQHLNVFGEFCQEHGLEVLTLNNSNNADDTKKEEEDVVVDTEKTSDNSILMGTDLQLQHLDTVLEQDEQQNDEEMGGIPSEIGITAASLLQSDEHERLRGIHKMTDQIRGISSPNQQQQEQQQAPLVTTNNSVLAAAPTSAATAIIDGSADAKPRAYKPPRLIKKQATSFVDVNDPPQIIVTTDSFDSQRLVLVGINTRDRAGLLLDISKTLLGLRLQLRHTEAAVVRDRSISVWRCEVMQGDKVFNADDDNVEVDHAAGAALPDVENIWSVLSAMLETETGIEAIKKRGLQVIRATVTRYSRLLDKAPAEVDFKDTYKAAIVAVQHQGGRRQSRQNKNKKKKNATDSASDGKSTTPSHAKLGVGDVLILQASDQSPLLKAPPTDFYKSIEEMEQSSVSRNSSVSSLVKLVTSRFSNPDLTSLAPTAGHDFKSDNTMEHANKSGTDEEEEGGEAGGFFISENDDNGSQEGAVEVSKANDDINDEASLQFASEQIEAAWKDLRVMLPETDNAGNASDLHEREFLSAMKVADGSAFVGKTAAKAGIAKLPGVFLVSIERPEGTPEDGDHKPKKRRFVVSIPFEQNAAAEGDNLSVSQSVEQSIRAQEETNNEPRFITIAPDEALMGGDVLWFAGPASAIGDLRKIPGLVSFENDEVEKINEKVYDRRLVQAVVARKGPLVGKTVRAVRFRTRYGAAVISVHRDGNRILDHPGQIRLQAGDVLLLEAGPTFIERNTNNDRSFALLAEVDDSAPPRLKKFIPALILTVAMLAVFTAGVADLLVCALIASVLMVVAGILSEQEARDAVNWEVYITIACAFGIGTALVNSGVAGGVADGLVSIGQAVGIGGNAGLYGAVYLATFLISSVVTNNAAAALIFPIAMDAAEQTGADRLRMAYTLMLGASASFMSPFGYTTNLLIYGPGGYKYKDFVYVGTPMQIVLWIVSVALVSNTVFPWYASWLVSTAIFVVIAAFRLCNNAVSSLVPSCNKKTRQDEEDDEDDK